MAITRVVSCLHRWFDGSSWLVRLI